MRPLFPGARNFVASFMATEDDTEIDVSGYNTDVVFHSAGNDILSNTQNFTLDAGQVVVLSGYSDIAANLDGFVGALVTSSKPIVVNSGNFRYLQILDAIRELDMAPVDTAKPIDVVRATVEEFTLKTEMLILMARKYYGQKTLLRTIDILLEGSYETARG